MSFTPANFEIVSPANWATVDTYPVVVVRAPPEIRVRIVFMKKADWAEDHFGKNGLISEFDTSADTPDSVYFVRPPSPLSEGDFVLRVEEVGGKYPPVWGGLICTTGQAVPEGRGAPDFENDRTLGQVSVGRGTYYHESTKFEIYHAGESIRIGRYCSIAAEVTLSTGGDHRPELPSTWPFDNLLGGLSNPTRSYRQTESLARGTNIGSDVWLGLGTHIAGGVQVGHGAIVGTRAVVFSDVPPYAIVLGNPAKIIRYRFSRECIAEMLRIQWWEWPAATIRERLDHFYEPIEDFIRAFRHDGG